MADVVRVEFDRVRKLKPRHRYLREAVRASGKSITELMADPFGGFPYLIQALTVPSANVGEAISIDKASEFLDAYFEKGGTVAKLQAQLVDVLSAYMNIEVAPAPEEEGDDDSPNADSPVAPGPSAD